MTENAEVLMQDINVMQDINITHDKVRKEFKILKMDKASGQDVIPSFVLNK